MTGVVMQAAGAQKKLALDGSLSRTQNANPVVSNLRTVIAPGTFLFNTLSGDDATPEYRLNGGSWTTITSGMTLTVAIGNTLEVRADAPALTNLTTFALRDNIGAVLIETVSLFRN